MDYGAKLAQLEQRLNQVERASRMSSASLDDTALEVRDSDGSLRAIVGQQADGTSGVNVVNGPVPPTPTDPTVEPALAALTVTWDGTFTDAPAAPLDWMRVEVHVGPVDTFTPDQGTLRDTIETAQGGSVVISLPYTEWFVKLRSRTTSGVAGAASNSVAGTPHKAEAADINAGAVTAEAIAVDALTGKTITGGLITGSVVQTAATGERIVLNEGESNQVVLYDANGDLAAAMTPDIPDGDAFDTPGLVAYGVGGGNDYAALAEGLLVFGTVDNPMNRQQKVQCFNGTEPLMALSSGRWESTHATAEIKLQSSAGALYTRPRIRMEGVGGSVLVDVTGDLHVTGTLYRDDAWSDLTFDTGWEGYGGTWGTGRYRLLPDGRVALRDLAKRTATTTPASTELIATLPVGYRPTTQWQITVPVGNTGGIVNLNVLPDGQITLTSKNTAANTYLSSGSGYVSLNNKLIPLD